MNEEEQELENNRVEMLAQAQKRKDIMLANKANWIMKKLERVEDLIPKVSTVAQEGNISMRDHLEQMKQTLLNNPDELFNAQIELIDKEIEQYGN